MRGSGGGEVSAEFVKGGAYWAIPVHGDFKRKDRERRVVVVTDIKGDEVTLVKVSQTFTVPKARAEGEYLKTHLGDELYFISAGSKVDISNVAAINRALERGEKI